MQILEASELAWETIGQNALGHQSGEPISSTGVLLFYVYVLLNPGGRLYIGSTQDIEERVRRHQNGGVRWTSQHGPWELAYKETFPSRSEAVRRERVLKSGKANQELRGYLRGEKSG